MGVLEALLGAMLIGFIVGVCVGVKCDHALTKMHYDRELARALKQRDHWHTVELPALMGIPAAPPKWQEREPEES